MKKIQALKIHTVHRNCGYYKNADDFWISVIQNRVCGIQVSSFEKIKIIDKLAEKIVYFDKY